MPSMVMEPLAGSVKRRRDSARAEIKGRAISVWQTARHVEDPHSLLFPEAVRPMRPIFSPGWMSKVMPCSTEGRVGSYLTSRSLTLQTVSDARSMCEGLADAVKADVLDHRFALGRGGPCCRRSMAVQDPGRFDRKFEV